MNKRRRQYREYGESNYRNSRPRNRCKNNRLSILTIIPCLIFFMEIVNPVRIIDKLIDITHDIIWTLDRHFEFSTFTALASLISLVLLTTISLGYKQKGKRLPSSIRTAWLVNLLLFVFTTNIRL